MPLLLPCLLRRGEMTEKLNSPQAHQETRVRAPAPTTGAVRGHSCPVPAAALLVESVSLCPQAALTKASCKLLPLPPSSAAPCTSVPVFVVTNVTDCQLYFSSAQPSPLPLPPALQGSLFCQGKRSRLLRSLGQPGPHKLFLLCSLFGFHQKGGFAISGGVVRVYFRCLCPKKREKKRKNN